MICTVSRWRRSREEGTSIWEAVFQSCITTAVRYFLTNAAQGWSSGSGSA